MSFSSNIPQINKRLRGASGRIGEKIAERIETLLSTIDAGVHDKTPVWSGLAVRNMIWTTGKPNTVEYPAIETGLDGEQRRGPNEEAARATLTAIVVKRPFSIYYLANAAHHIVDLEHGLLPSPERSRVPKGGMFGLTYAEVTAKLRAAAL